MPVAAVAGETRGLDRQHRPDTVVADGGQQSLKAWTGDATTRSSEIVVDDLDMLESERVRVPGFLHDVEPYFTRSRVFVTPVRFGAGMKGKIGQSLGYGLPVVSTSVGVEGFGLKDGENCLVADSDSAFADAVVRLYRDRELWQKLSTAGVAAVAPFTPAAIRPRMLSLLRRLNEKKRAS